MNKTFTALALGLALAMPLAGCSGGDANRSGGAANQDPVEDIGQGIENTLDDMGDAARDMGRDAQRATR